MEKESGVEERTPLEQMIYNAVYAAFRDWLDEEGVAEQMCDATRDGTTEALEGAIPFWRKKAAEG